MNQEEESGMKIIRPIMVTLAAAAILGGASLVACSPQRVAPAAPAPKATASVKETPPMDALSPKRDAIITGAYADCDGLSIHDFRLCVSLAVVPASSHTNADGSKITNPDGAALVRECLEQYGPGSERDACFMQPGTV
jgi:hypothetical protein